MSRGARSGLGDVKSFPEDVLDQGLGSPSDAVRPGGNCLPAMRQDRGDLGSERQGHFKLQPLGDAPALQVCIANLPNNFSERSRTQTV